MYDYTKLQLPVEVGRRLLSHPALSFIGRFDRSTGAVLGDEPCIAEYGPPVAIGRNALKEYPDRALRFTVYPSGRAILSGSLHKYAQDGTNCGDFTFPQFVATVAGLCDTFSLDPATLILLQLEVGANVEPPLLGTRVLEALVCNGPGIDFERHRWFQGRTLARKAIRCEYEVKVYDKGSQYRLDRDVLRFEVKFTKARQLHDLNIYTLNDLLNPDAWRRLHARVMAIYDEVFIAEPSIDLRSMTEPQRTFVTVAGTPSHWQKLSPQGRNKARARYAAIGEHHGSGNLKNELGRTLAAKLNDLLNPPLWAVASGDVFTKIGPGSSDAAGGRFHGSVKVGNRPPIELRCCQWCGRDISDQRKGSRYCSERRHGTDGKRCRNAGSNPRNNRLRSIARIEGDPLLFDHSDYILPAL